MRIVRRLLGYVGKERGLLFAAAGCMVLLAAATSAYAFLIGPVGTFLITGGAEGAGKTLSVIPALARLDRAQVFVVLPLLLIGVAALKGLAYFGQFFLMGMLGQRVVARLRRDYFESLLRQTPAFFGQRLGGDLLSRFSADIAHVERAVTYALASYVRDSLAVVALLGLAFWLDWRMSVVAFVGVPVVVVPIGKLARKLKRRASQSQESLGKLLGLVQEGLWGVRVIQAYRSERRELARFDAENGRCLRAELKSAKARSIAPAILEIASVAGLALVLKLAAEAVTRGAADPERLLSFLATVALVFQPAKDLGRVGQFVIHAIASGERIFEVLDHAPPVRALPAARPLAPMGERLAFEAVRFAYREAPVLDGVSFELRRGEVVALVGESGAGKSTAALLAMRFADPQAGAVRVDGADLREAALPTVRRQFGLVTQEPLLFSGTVAENIAYGRPVASEAEITRAAEIAQADGFIRLLPHGYATPLGERGARLSGGQKQRIALARALLANAPVLLLDEATSNLDAESEREVSAALAAALQGRTALVIAHRLSTIRNANRIVVLRRGKVVEQGTHDGLLAQDGEYARLYRCEEEAA